MNKRLFGVLALCSILSSGMTAVAVRAVDSNTINALTTTDSQAPGQPVDLTYAAEKATNSVVFIKVTTNSKQQEVEYYDPFADFFGDFFGGGRGGQQRRQVETPKRQGSGSGVILTADGYIVTNNHVVGDADEILVKLNDNREFKGRIIGTDKDTDLAIIKIEAKDLTPIEVASSDDLKVGEWVLAIGNPYGLTSTVTAGIVSAKARSLHSQNPVESFIQTDAAINPGNSGGALVNAKGQLVGINAMLYSQTGSYSGYGFAIPTTIMNKVYADIKEFGTVQRALLGIAGADVTDYIDKQKEKGKTVDLGTLTGVYVDEVTSDGAADAAGLESGDVIIEVDGKKIEKFGELQEVLASHRPGDKIKVVYIRDKKKKDTILTLRNAQGTTSQLQSIDNDDMGAAMRPLTNDEMQELGLRYGLLVTSLRNGKMQEAGITKGLIITMVNNVEMRTLDDFNEVLKKANMSTDRVLWIRAKTQSGINKSFTVELGDPKPEKQDKTSIKIPSKKK